MIYLQDLACKGQSLSIPVPVPTTTTRQEHSTVYRNLGIQCGRLMTVFSLCGLIIISLAFYRGLDATAIMSNVPQWIWAIVLGMPAILAWIFFRTRMGLFVFILWSLFGITTLDSLPSLARTGMNQYKLPLHPGLQSWRVVTLDCKAMETIPVASLAKLNANVIFLQGARDPNQTVEMALALFGNSVQVRQIRDCAIICENGVLSRATDIPNTDGLIVDWFPPRSSMPVRLVNVSLAHRQAQTNFLLPDHWKYYSKLRATHRIQIDNLLKTLKKRGSNVGNMPIVMAGNFNASPTSSIFRVLGDNFLDVYKEKGTGLGSTTPSRFPLLRQNRIFTTLPLIPVHADTVSIPGAIHRAVVSDVAKHR